MATPRVEWDGGPDCPAVEFDHVVFSYPVLAPSTINGTPLAPNRAEKGVSWRRQTQQKRWCLCRP